MKLNHANLLATTAAALAILSFTSGCASIRPGKAHERQELDGIVEGQTTKAWVRAKIGQPQTVSRASDGTETWCYNWCDVRTKAIGACLASVSLKAISSFAPAAAEPSNMLATAFGLSKPSYNSKTTTVAFNARGFVKSVNYDKAVWK